jgi:hypothetical protein
VVCQVTEKLKQLRARQFTRVFSDNTSPRHSVLDRIREHIPLLFKAWIKIRRIHAVPMSALHHRVYLMIQGGS